jgi:hypothetical protein
MPTECLRSLEGRTAASEWVENCIAWIGGQLDASGGNHRLEFIHVPARFVLLMTGWRRVVPEIGEIETERVQIFSVAAIVLNVLPAVAALGNR